MNFFQDKFPNKRARATISIVGSAALLFLVVSAFYFFQISPPKDFPTNKSIVVSNGMSLSQIAQNLADKHVIRSPFWFVNMVILQKHEKQVVGGQYYFNEPENVYRVARRLALGEFGIEQLKTTIPEGSTVEGISEIIKKNYPNFDTKSFVELAKGKEGYLFPDSYYFGTEVSPARALAVMTGNFSRKIGQPEVQAALKASGHSLPDALAMASILESEARLMNTRQIIAGILWKRISVKMPLQVDVSFLYINGKTTSELTLRDLKNPSLYNSYNHLGLPPTPINNPGLDSLMAALTPIKTDYLYFLSDKNGVMHYARTLDEHAKNKQKYL